jgi:heme-degrading monooxygenase HmoA
MVTILWEYQVKTERRAEFETVYAANGAWAELFRKGKGFLGTKLFHSLDHPQLYTTIDQWASMKEYKAFLSQWKEEYEALDKECEGLTEHESCLGTFGQGCNDEE